MVVETITYGEGLFRPGSYSAGQFRKLARRLLREGEGRDIVLALRFREEEHEYRNPGDREKLRAFVESLPEGLHLFQKALRYEGPQRCVH